MSFANFPFQEIISHADNGSFDRNRFAAIWEYIIYCYVLILIRDNQRVPEQYRKQISDVLGADKIVDLLPAVKQWTMGGSLPTLLSLNLSRSQEPKVLGWAEKIRITRNAIRDLVDDSEYWILLDDLDEDYEFFEDRGASYNELMAGLFKAVISANSFFASLRSAYLDGIPQVRSVAVLRDDIFSGLRDNQRNSWLDHIAEAKWDFESIWKAIAYRVGPLNVSNPGDEAKLHKIIDIDDFVPAGTPGRGHKPLAFINHMTQRRIRDAVMYVKLAAAEALRQEKSRIDGSCIKKSAVDFSSYLRREIEDEMLGVRPNINVELRVFSMIGKQSFRFAELINALEALREEIGGEVINPVTFADQLFRFGVIGNLGRRQFPLFYYDSPNGRLNRGEAIGVHRGLLAALQVM